MRTILLGVMVTLACTHALAQSTERPKPKGTEVVDKVLPPPVVKDYQPKVTAKGDTVVKDGKEIAPQVTIRKEGDTTIEEYRQGGKLYKQRVTPLGGASYILIDEKGEGKFTRVDGPDVKLNVPMWVLFTW
ncbi:MAG: DUF2782 domain-containing protein [Betaproteobacteria bacterium]|nr:DUF2782 domain-containing protein [Betaproteobacteria bacterium]